MKLVFFGTTDFSKPVFEAFKKTGYSPTLWDSKKNLEEFKKLNPDICVVVAYGKIIPKEWLEIPKSGFLNVHPSFLPKYRGASPIQTAILNGDKETGVTIILMDEKIDHGPILTNSKFEIRNSKTHKELEKKLAELGAKLLIEILPKWISGEIEPKEQNHSKATYTGKFLWLDGKIDWQKSAGEIDRQIRALNPEPGVWTEWNPSTHSTNAQGGEQSRTTSSGQVSRILKILEALVVSDKNDTIKPGQVFIAENKKAAIKCGFNTALLLEIVQLEGKKPMEIKNFLNGHRNFIGSKLT